MLKRYFLVLALLVSISIQGSVAWANVASGECIKAHISVVTFLGRKVDRRGIPLATQAYNGGFFIKSEETNKDGETCIKYSEELSPGDKIKLYPQLRTINNEVKEDWSAWRILSPYRGITIIPKNKSDSSVMEILIALPALDDALMTLVRRKDEDSKPVSIIKQSKKKFLQIISLGKKEQAMILVKALRNRNYQACIEPIFSKGRSMNRVLVEKQDEVSLERLCHDMKVTFLPDAKFRCRIESRFIANGQQGILCN